MKHIIINLLLLLTIQITAAQQKGKVVSKQDGKPLSGVTIKTRTATLHTNNNGEFTIPSKTDTLQFSHLGYLTIKMPINKATFVELEPQQQTLTEVSIVSSGYQKLPKERATGSFSYISQKTFNEQVGTTVLNRLEATANGLFADRSTSGGNGKLIIRGLSTIRGPKDALIILDNFPYEGNLDNLNPNDIENVTVLKDAAATSIWGARAGNGVIVITTKKGSYNQPINIDFNVNTTIIQKPDLYYLRQMSSPDFISAEEFLYSKGKYTSELNSISMPGQTPIIELLIKKDKGQISQADYDAEKLRLSKTDIRDQYNKYLYTQGLNQQYALNLRGGTTNHTWTLSSGYDLNSSTLSEKYNRYNLRFQHTFKPVKNLELTTGAYYTQSKTTSGKPGYGQITSRTDLYPYARFADDNGNPLPIMKNNRTGYIDTAGKGRLLDWTYYPLEDYKHTTVTQTISDIVIYGGISYKLLKGLTTEIKYQYERQQTNGNDLKDEQSYFARNLVNSFTQLPAGQPPIYKVPKGGILDLSNALLQSSNLRGQLNYANQWGKNEINIIAGAERRDSKTNTDQSRIYGYRDDILTYGNVDYLNPYPDYKTGTLSYIPDNRNLQGLVNRFVSTYANGSYTYNSKYTVSLSGRRDASNLFGLNTNDQWNPLWSAGLSWELSKEKFMKFPYLRLRATYGFSGNIDPAMSAVTTITYLGMPLVTPSPYARYSNYYNPDLTWEKSRMLNLGLDFKIKSITGSIEYFNKRGTNLFGNGQIDYTGGVGSTILKNVASTSGNGLDLELNSINIHTDNFSWTTNLNASFYKDKVDKYYLSGQQASSFIGPVPILTGVSGKPVYSIFSYKWAGLDPLTGSPRGYLKGVISTDYAKLTGSATTLTDLNYHGSALPVYYGSLGNTFSYKSFSLSARLIYKLGYYFRRTSIQYGSLFTNGTSDSDYALRWQKPGDEKTTNVPSMIYPNASNRDAFYAGSDVLVEKGDHIRLQYINLSYALNQKLGLPVKSLSVYVNAANLGLLWTANKEHIDPDYQGAKTLQPSKTFSIGLRANLN